jgi:Nucleotidyltransferase of unknown function (DUF6036)
MKLVDAAAIGGFLTALGARQAEPVQLSLLGGCALILLGSPRTTADIDYVGDDIRQTGFQQTIVQVASELQLKVEPVPIDRFVPLPPDSEARRVFIARYGMIDVYVVDPYVIALSKLDRGFDTDFDDIVFLITRGMVNLERLAELVASTLMQAAAYNMDPAAMHQHLAIVRQRASHP